MLEFFEQAANLKNVNRKGWIDKLGIENPESVADHCFSMSVMAMILSELENLDTTKILKMVILHDLAESEIGDITPEQITQNKKKDLENKTICKILNSLPRNISTQYKKIWNDYAEKKSAESIFVHEIDKLEMVLQLARYSKNKSYQVQYESFTKTAKREIKNKRLQQLLAKLLQSFE